METVKVGMREFRENLAGYLESGTTLAIMRHGETIGFYIPAQKRSRKAELEAMRAAAKDLDEMIASWSASEDELMEEYKGIRRAARENKRNAGYTELPLSRMSNTISQSGKRSKCSRAELTSHHGN